MPDKEVDLEDWCEEYVHKRKLGWCLKLEIKGQRGFPDRTFFLRGGVAVVVEFKTPKGKHQPLQEFWLTRLTLCGFRTATIRTKQEFLDLLADVLK